MEENANRLLATRIAAKFAEVGFDAIPAIEEYMRSAAVPREVSYGCRVRFWLDKDENLRAQLVPAAPKLPTVELERFDFTLAWQDGQLAFDYDGVPEAGDAKPTADDAAPSSPNPRANGTAVPSPVECEAVETTGQHAWLPVKGDDGSFVCASCRETGRMTPPPRPDPRAQG